MQCIPRSYSCYNDTLVCVHAHIIGSPSPSPAPELGKLSCIHIGIHLLQDLLGMA